MINKILSWFRMLILSIVIGKTIVLHKDDIDETEPTASVAAKILTDDQANDTELSEDDNYSEVLSKLERKYSAIATNIAEDLRKAAEGLPKSEERETIKLNFKLPTVELSDVNYINDACIYYDGVEYDLTKEYGQPGVPWASGKLDVEKNQELEPWLARGLGNDTGVYYDLINTPIVEQSLSKPVRAIAATDWRVEKHKPSNLYGKRKIEKHHKLISAVIDRWGQYRIIKAVEEILLNVPVAGFCLWEVTYERVTLNIGQGTRTYWLPKIPKIRLPNTVEYWLTCREDFKGVIFRYDHVTDYDGTTGVNRVVVPASKLLHIANKQSGSNLEGRSSLRPCYSQILMLRALQQLQMLAIEINGLGDVVVTLPQRISNKDKEALQRHLANVVARLVPYTLIPYGAEYSRTSPNTTTPNLQPVIDAVKSDIALALDNIGDLIGLVTKGGSFAMKETISEDAAKSLDYIVNVLISGPIEEQIFLKTLELNYPEDKLTGYAVPHLVCGNVSERDTGKWVENVVKANGNAAVLYNNDDIGKAVRSALDLPTNLETAVIEGDESKLITDYRNLLDVLPRDSRDEIQENSVKVITASLNDIIPQLDVSQIETIRQITISFLEDIGVAESSKIISRIISSVRGDIKEAQI